MKKFLLVVWFGFTIGSADAQCPFDNAFLLDATPACPGTFTVGCMNGGEYVTVDVVAGNTYSFTTCGGTTLDTELTLYDPTGTIILDSNDDDCGTQSTITWVATLTGTVNLMLDEYPCSNSGLCIDLEITCTPPVQSGNGCNTDITICTPGVAGPFGFNTPGAPVSSCLDFFGPDYAYIVLYITSSGPLDLLIDGDAATGYLDVAIFDIPTGEDPCVAIGNVGNEISCNYADFDDGCNQFGTYFPCGSSVPAPNVTAGDVLMIVVENWSGTSTNFTLELAPPPSAQTGPPDPTIIPAGPFCNTDAPFQMTAVNMGGEWTGTGVSLTGMFDPAAAGIGSFPIDYSIGQPPCQAQSQTTVDVIDCSSPCNIDNFNVSIGACEPGSLYMMDGTIEFTNAPAGGTLIVEVDNGTTIYDTIINPPFVSPATFSISGIPADGANSTITVYFSADPTCTSTINYVATAPCACTAEIGTFTATITGSSTNNYVLCYGDQIDINTNNDWVEPGEMFAPPGPAYDPGVSWLIYSCPPTVALVPNTTTDVPDDPCFLGLVSDFNLSDLNDLAMINAFPPGTFTDNTIYYVPITMYSMSNGTYSYVNTSMPCYELGPPFAVQYLPEFTFSITEDCTNGSATVTVNGGLPAIDGSAFTASNLLPGTASFGNTTAPDGGTIVINGLTSGEMYSFTITDGNGCPYTINGGPFVPSPIINAGPDQAICAGDAVTLSGSGAGVGGSYSWDNGVTDGVSFNPGATLTYTVTGTDAFGCAGTDQVTVTVNPIPVIDAGPDQTICAGNPVTLSGSGAGVGGSYTWDNGVTDGVAFNPTGTLTYTVTGTDANLCVSTDQVVVTVNPLPVINAGPDQAICAGDPVTLNGSGAGVGGSYTWDNGVTDGVAFNPAATLTYTVTGTDANLCSNTDQVTVTVNPLPVINAGPDQAICAGDPVTLSGSGAGVGGSYTWDNSVTDGVAFNPAATLTYTVTGTDANLCVNTDQAIVTVNPLPVIDAGPDQAICAGDPVTLNGSGAGIGGSYTWDNGVTDGAAFNPAATLTYTVTGTDVNLCVNTDQVTVTVNPLPVIDAGPDQAICAGDPVTLNGSGAGVGGSYTWDNGVTDGVAFNPVATLTYTVTGTDVNLCSNTDQVTVTVNPLPVINAGPDQSICTGGSVTLTGTGAGVGGSYTWDNGVTDGIAFSPAATLTYTVTGTDANLCSNTDQVIVSVGSALVVDAGPDVSICPGSSIQLNGSGPGTPTWSPGATLSATNILNPLATPAATTTYTLVLDDGAGCTGSDDVTITILNPAPIVVSPDVSICAGDCTTLTVTGGDFFAWDQDPDIADSSLTSQNVCPAVTTTYNVTSYTLGSNLITNGDFNSGNTGFSSDYTFVSPTNTAEAQYNVTSNPQTYNGAFSSCGDNTTGTGNMMVINGSSTPGETVWCQTIPVTANTDYLFSAWLASVFPVNPAVLQFTINGVAIGADLNASPTTCDWAEFFSTWNSGAVTSATICITNLNTNINGNDFALDDISFSPVCTQTASITVTVDPQDDPSFNYTSGLTYCQTSPDPVPTITGLSGGTFSYTVISGGPFLDIDPATGTITNATSDLGNYDITYNTTGAPGSLCPQSATVTLSITAAPVADFTLDEYCANAADPLPTFINGGTAGLFSSAPAGLVLDPATGSVDLDASTPGTYTVTNTIDVPGCALAVFDDDIVIYELPDATIAGSAAICPGAALPDITIDLTAGAAPWDLTYNYDGNPVTVTAATSPYTIAGAAVGAYDLVSVTDANGCTNTVSGNATVTELAVPVIDPLTDQEVCEGADLAVQPFSADIAGTTFDWTNGTGTDIGFGLGGSGNIGTFTSLNGSGTDLPVTISVTPTSPDGCVGAPADFLVTVHPVPLVSFSADPTSGCAPLTVTFQNNSIPAGVNCTWDFGNGTTGSGCDEVTAVYEAGTYSVSLTVTTAEGCTGSFTEFNYITATETPVAAFTFTPQIINIDNTEVEFTNESLFAQSYEWDFGDESPVVDHIDPIHFYPTVPGEYVVTLTAYDSSGDCFDIAEQLIIVEDVIIFYVPNVFTPDHDEFNEGFHPVFTSGFDPLDYHLTIFNRWGEIIFESYDASKGWDGTYSDQGLVQDGVYVWQIEFKESMSDKRHTHRGHVTVLK